jgi:hypothetical protein
MAGEDPELIAAVAAARAAVEAEREFSREAAGEDALILAQATRERDTALERVSALRAQCNALEAELRHAVEVDEAIHRSRDI